MLAAARRRGARRRPRPGPRAIGNDYQVTPDITYLTASNWEAKLDVYTPRGAGPHPTVLHIHGGGWTGGSRESVILRAMPFLEMGFAVVNISYRLARVAEAPAAVEDCLCALRWVIRNAKQYNFDVNRIVVTGYSAGGHLALTTGMIPASAGLDRQCPGPEELKVAAIVNWYGITDVADLLDGANRRTYAVQWLGSRPDRVDVAQPPFADGLRPPRSAADADHPWRRRSDGAVCARDDAACRAAEGGRDERAGDDPEGRTRQLPAARPAARRRSDARLPGAPRHHAPPGGDVGCAQ